MIKFYVLTMSALLLASNVASSAPNPTQALPTDAQPAMVRPLGPVAPVPTKALNVPASTKDDRADVEVSVDKKDEYQEVIDAYKTYLTTVSKDTIEEIRAYRIEMVQINKKKKALYKSLSQEAQKYLAQESAMKRKLPVNKRKFTE